MKLLPATLSIRSFSSSHLKAYPRILPNRTLPSSIFASSSLSSSTSEPSPEDQAQEDPTSSDPDTIDSDALFADTKPTSSSSSKPKKSSFIRLPKSRPSPYSVEPPSSFLPPSEQALLESHQEAPPAWFISPPSSSPSLAGSKGLTMARPSFLPAPLPSPSSLPSPPSPPKSIPEALHPFHNYLHTLPILRQSHSHSSSSQPTPPPIMFFNTSKPAPRTIPIVTDRPQNGKTRRLPMDGGVGITLGMEVGGSWEWVVIVEVLGRSVGDVKRAEGAIREWLSLNPLHLPSHPPSRISPKIPRAKKSEPPSEWALIDTGVGVVVHVMTAGARERWGVEGVWEGGLAAGGGGGGGELGGRHGV